MRLRLRCLFGFAILCGVAAVAPAQACEHDMCLTGDPLDPTPGVCDPCVADICAVDPYCCDLDGYWDGGCVDQVAEVCGLTVCTAACEHALCEVGGPLDSGCNTCAWDVCHADPLCCNSQWDTTCVALVETACGNVSCTQGADLCAGAVVVDNTQPEGVELMGTLVGMSNDGCASVGNSCSMADVWYSYTVPLDATKEHRVNTCGTQHSFGIDTVVSYHTDCPGDLNTEYLANDDWKNGYNPSACLYHLPERLLDSALPFPFLQPGATWKVRVSLYGGDPPWDPPSPEGPYQIYFPEPSSALLGGVGLATVFALSRWRLRRRGRAASG